MPSPSTLESEAEGSVVEPVAEVAPAPAPAEKKKKQKHGETPYIVAYTYDESPMPTRREYYESLSDKIE